VGLSCRNPTQVINNPRFAEMLDELRRRYDRVFIDSPPIGAVSDALHLIPKVDGVLYVVRFNVVSARNAAACLARLRDAGFPLAWISGRASGATTARATELKIPHVIQGRIDKLTALTELAASLGVTLLAALVEQAARALDTGWDIEIAELHHRHKVDAPSGTALFLGEAAARGRGAPLEPLRLPPHEDTPGSRRAGGIGFATLRGGSAAGDHRVLLAGEGERIDKPCKPCSGEGRTVAESSVNVRIPPGVDTGTKLRSSGNGSAGRRGAQAGDLYVYITVQEHELFERDGDDLACSVPVKFSVAALGGKIVVPKLKGKTNLNIPAGTQGGTIFRLRGEGMPPLRGSTSGDLLVRVDIDVPKKMTDKEKEALKAYAAACGDEAAPVSESWRSKFKKFFP
jgi:hypothetical protein